STTAAATSERMLSIFSFSVPPSWLSSRSLMSVGRIAFSLWFEFLPASHFGEWGGRGCDTGLALTRLLRPIGGWVLHGCSHLLSGFIQIHVQQPLDDRRLVDAVLQRQRFDDLLV